MGMLTDNNTVDDGSVYLSDFCTEVGKSPTPSSGNSEKNQKRRKHKHIERFTMADVTASCTIASPAGGTTKGKGKRRQRRLENVRYLLSLWGKDDEEQDDVLVQDEPLQTIFTQIVTDDSCRKIWNNFADLSGQEQDEYLTFIGQSASRRKKWTQLTSSTLEHPESPAFRMDICDTTVPRESMRADCCYQRIERKLRNALNKNHVPLGMLERLETELTTFFMKWPVSKYTSILSNSYERLLMHALCQYLGLRSQSVTRDGERCTQVQTKGSSSFHPPAMSLCQYIKDKL